MSEEIITIYCANHPQVETSLRCNNCEKPICPRCAVKTPTGYRCRECVRGQQKQFETAQWYDYLLAVVLAAGLSFLGSLIAQRLFIFIIFVAPIIGVGIAEAIRFVIQKRRSKRLFQFTAAASVLGSSPLLLLALLSIVGGVSGFGSLWGILWQGFYTFTVASTLYYRLSGISVR
jgi:hypothetical protein